MKPLLNRAVSLLRATPLHPQWLLGSKRISIDILGRYLSGLVLDVGCADRWIESLLPAECCYIGLDYLATGREFYAAQPDVFADASRLPFQDACVDTIVLFEVLEHLPAPQAALSEVARVLRKGGHLLLTVPFLYPIHDAPYDFQRYTSHGLKREICAVGLQIDRLETTLGCAESAGLMSCLAIGGMILRAWQLRRPVILLIPLLLLSVIAINLSAWVCGKIFPSWNAMTAGYRVVASKT